MRRTAVLFAALVILVVPMLAGCSAGTKDDGRSGMLAALAVIEAGDIHGMSERLTSPHPTIDPGDLARVRHARIAAATAAWPPELQKKAQTFTAAADQLAAALEKDDGDAAAKAILGAHAAYHALADGGWEALGDQSGTRH